MVSYIYVMKRTTRNPQLARQTIIEKSAPVFNTYGYAGTSMAMLIEATGFKKGGIYNHFTSKSELAQAAFQYNYALLRQNYVKITFEYDNPKDQLIAFIEAFKAFTLTPTITGGCPILNQSTESDDTDEVMRQVVKAAMEDWKLLLQNILEAGKKSGAFNTTIDPSKEAYFILSTIEGAIMLGKLKRSTGLMRDVADQLKNYIDLRILG